MNKHKIVQSLWFKILRKIFLSNRLIQLPLMALNDEKYFKYKYWWSTLNKLNLNNPQQFTEKLQWINYHSKEDPLRTKVSDKYLVREYINERLGEDEADSILCKLYGVYYNIDDINFDSLPTSCVLKANHGSGWNLIIKDKNKINWDKAKEKMRKWLRTNYYYNGRQYHYKNIKPAIICEEFLENEDGTEILDYKFLCFNGEPTVVWIDYDRYTLHVRNFYNLDGQPLHYESDVPADYSKPFIKPKNFDKMINIAKELSKPFPHARIDLYNLNGRIVFGEITLVSWGGYVSFESPELDLILGQSFEVPNREV